MSNGTKVVKRNGKTEPLDLNKLHVMVEEACKDLANVSASQVEMQSGIQFYDGITTAEIQEILIRSASDLIDLDHPNYQFVAARLLLFALRKQLFGRMHECPTVKQHVERCVGRGVYDSEILTMYSDEEFDKLESFVDHSRDYLFTYAGLRQVVDKYLVQDRSTGALYDMAIGRYVAQRAGIGINAGRIRGINSKIRGGEVQHTGVVPFLKKFEATVRCCTQNGIRGGSATVHFPIWHQEIEDILVLKNNKGTEDNRVRKLDYSIQTSKLFYERFIQNGEISLFSPHSVPGLYDAFGTDGFDELYVRYERDESIPRKTIAAQELFLSLLKERAETGRLYIMNIDHCNSHSSFLDKVEMSNLCQEITLPTKPLQHIDDTDGEIALCILSAINVGKVRELEDLQVLCDLAVRSLDELIDFQGYPVRAAEIATRARRSLGVGFIGLAHYLAKHGEHYDDPGAWKLVHDLTEAFQYYLIQATVNLAKEKGACEYSHRTKYGQGILPIDTYKKDVDEIVPNELKYDWESLRAQVLQYGVRNSTLSAQMPSESSSVVSNTYKYGWKTSYYQNTHDMKNDEVEETRQSLENLVSDILESEEEDCESCKI